MLQALIVNTPTTTAHESFMLNHTTHGQHQQHQNTQQYCTRSSSVTNWQTSVRLGCWLSTAEEIWNKRWLSSTPPHCFPLVCPTENCEPRFFNEMESLESWRRPLQVEGSLLFTKPPPNKTTVQSQLSNRPVTAGVYVEILYKNQKHENKSIRD